MKEYESPKTNPAPEHHVAGVNPVEINESVYKSAKLQNKIRWLLVFAVSILALVIANTFVHIVPAAGIACFCGVIFYKLISKLFSLADMTSTAKFKKFGNDLRIKKATEKSQSKVSKD